MLVITGGAGFIGSNLVAGLEEQGYNDIVICDRMGTDDKWRNIGKRELRDVVAPENLFDYLEQNKKSVEVVFHLGGISSTTEMNADAVISNNFSLSRALWKWCAQNGVRLIYASSASTYGDGTAGFVDDDSPEGLARLRPLSPFAWSKHLFDRRVARVRMDGKEALPPQWVGLKFFNPYGPNEYHKADQMSVPSKLCPQVVAGAAAKLFKSNNPQYKDGGQMRDFIYVKDCVDILVWMYQNPKVSGLFNAGTGKARTFNDMASAVFNAMGKPPKITYIDMPQALQDRYQNFSQADVTKLRSVGYTKAFIELEDGIKDYVTNYLSQPDRYR